MNKTNHTFVYSLSPGSNAMLSQAQAVAPLVDVYRITGDWHGPQGAHAWDYHLTQAAAMQSMIGVQGRNGQSFPDLDMLSASLTDDRDQVMQMTLWAITKSPLIIGMDIRGKNASSMWWYTNKEVLEVQGSSVGNEMVNMTNGNGGIETAVWKAHASNTNTTTFVALMNVQKQEYSEMSVSFSSLNVGSTKTCTLRDLWTQADLGQANSFLRLTLPPSTARLLSLRDCK
eukprot:m.81581 g.81581  ORF g.81581 m.81581 type:complete len:229 (+) comp12061_c0_seq2:149-835(+)